MYNNAKSVIEKIFNWKTQSKFDQWIMCSIKGFVLHNCWTISTCLYYHVTKCCTHPRVLCQGVFNKTTSVTFPTSDGSARNAVFDRSLQFLRLLSGAKVVGNEDNLILNYFINWRKVNNYTNLHLFRKMKMTDTCK